MGSSCSKNNYNKSESQRKLFEESCGVADNNNLSKSEIYSDGESCKNRDMTDSSSQITSKSKRGFYTSEDQATTAERFRACTISRDFNTSEVIEIPPDMDVKTWIYIKAKFYLEECELLFESVSDQCNPYTCPEMTAGPHYTYLWKDETHPEPISMPACNYISNVFIWTKSVFDSEEFSKIEEGIFPDDYMDIMRTIFKKLFRVYAHVYHHHLNAFIKCNYEYYLNTSFKYFGIFVRKYDLITRKEEAPLRKLLRNLIEEDELRENISVSSDSVAG